MHHDGIGPGQRKALGRQAKQPEVILAGGDAGVGETLALHAQHHHHIHVSDAAFDVFVTLAAGELPCGGHQCRGCDQPQFAHAQGLQRLAGRARHARVPDVAHDGHGKLIAMAFVLQDGERVEQALRRVRQMRLAGRQHAHRRPHMAGHQRRHTGLGIAHDEHIDVQRFEGEHGVEHALALHARRELHLQVDHVGAQALGRQLEGHARARGRLGEQVGHREARQCIGARRHLAAAAHVVLGAFEQGFQFVARQALEGEQVSQAAIRPPLVRHARIPCVQGWFCSQLPRITAAAALSMSPGCSRRLRSPLARRDLSSPAASTEE